MKTDLVSSVIAAVIGTLVAYFVCNIFVPKIENYTITTLTSGASYELVEPNNEVFNFRAVNPTVEVYVGNCSNGNCDETIIVENSDNNQGENEDNENINEDNQENQGQEENSDNSGNSEPSPDEEGQNGVTD